MELGLDDRTALVTGGSAGLGLAIARTLASHGARVAMVARDGERLGRAVAALRAEHGDRAVGITADVTAPDDVARAVDEAASALGPVQILVNNAGQSMARPFLDADDETWQYDLDLKLMAAVRFSRLVVPMMQANGGGRIVNILATAGKAPPARSAPTSVSRAAGMALTKTLSKEYARDGILVNAVLIGQVKSEQWVRQWEAAGRPGTLDDWYARMAEHVPVGRIAEASELADLVAFLVSERASFLTGVAINFDGGASPVV